MNNVLKKYTIALLAIISIFATYSCEKEIDIDLKSVTPRLVLEGIVKEGELARVRVSQTIDFDDNNGYPFLSGAIVKISDDAGNSETLVQNSSGWYVANSLFGVQERTYNMSVTYEGKEYTSTSYMPPQVPLDSVTITKLLFMDYGLPMVNFQDPKGETNRYYKAVVYINGKENVHVKEATLDTEHFDGFYIKQWIPVFTEKDEDPIKKGDTISVEFQCIDKGVHDFFDTLSQENPNNPTTNIKGGALGYFAAFTSEKKEVIADWKD